MSSVSVVDSGGRHGSVASWRPSAAESLSTLKLAAPIALIALVNMAMSVTDTVMAAGFGAEALAAVAVGSDFYSIIFYFVAGVVGGLGPFYAAAIAAEDLAKAHRLRQTGWILLVVAALGAVPAVWYAPAYLTYLGLEPDLLAEGAAYTRAMALTLLPMLVVSLFRTRLMAEERPTVLLRVTFAAVPLNAGLNYVLMYGVGTWPGLGVTGAGLSSLAVATFIASALLIVGARGEPLVDGRLPGLSEVLEVLRTGVQIGVATVAEVGIFLGATLFAATLSAPEVAAHAVAMRAAGLAYALPTGLMQAALVRTARAEGLGSIERRREAFSSSLFLGALAGLLLFAILASIAIPLSSHLYPLTPSGRASAEAATVLVLMVGVIQLYDAPGAVASGALRALKDTRIPMIYTLVSYWGVSAPLGIWLAQGLELGATGIWIGLAGGTATASTLMLLRLGRHWKMA